MTKWPLFRGMLSQLHLLLLLQLTLHRGGAHGLQWLRFTVPRWVVEGADVQLTCQFDVEKDMLYSVKWYKQGREFYRYVPAEPRMKQDYPLPGVIVDKERSGAQQVTLRSVGRESAGRYKCEVLTEAPLFRTLVKSGEMGVVQLPRGPLTVTGGQDAYQPGTNVTLNCSAPHSLPASELTWYINDQQAPQEYLVNYRPQYDPSGGVSPRLGLHFTAQRWHFPTGELRLKCTAALHRLYTEEALHRGAASPPDPGLLMTDGADKMDISNIFTLTALLLLLG
ncbi:cell adhesion molecule 3 [Hyalella azteca]|uniref:Cell adhesion molecule 3 n=1 Tax=Hyalella azteca TaxID=294128 RepID=A0A979FJA0_HYAAZ|nr:cell adhesion molecule 3 [Hyalella azteca]